MPEQRSTETVVAPMIGDVVHYVVPSVGDTNDIRAALVTGAADHDPHTLHLSVFTTQGWFAALSVGYDPAGAECTWHWRPERSQAERWLTPTPHPRQTDGEEPADPAMSNTHDVTAVITQDS